MIDQEEYGKIIDECHEISIKKNKDYGDLPLKKFGHLGIICRMFDKMERIVNLGWSPSEEQRAPTVNEEKLEDTAKDLINYSIYLVMSLRGKL